MEYFKLPMPQTREAKHKSSNNNISYGKLAAGSIMMNNRLFGGFLEIWPEQKFRVPLKLKLEVPKYVNPFR